MNEETTLAALLLTAVLTGMIHTIAGPDHYLPFVAISKSRNYGWSKTLFWTILCGIGHVGSAIVLALGFILFAEILTESRLEWLEAWRGDIAAYAMIGMGAALILHSLHKRWKHRAETHSHPENNSSLSYWVVFIIFVQHGFVQALKAIGREDELGIVECLHAGLSHMGAVVVALGGGQGLVPKINEVFGKGGLVGDGGNGGMLQRVAPRFDLLGVENVQIGILGVLLVEGEDAVGGIVDKEVAFGCLL